MKRQIKQTLAKVLVVCMILSMLPVSAFAATEVAPEEPATGIAWEKETGSNTYYVVGTDVKAPHAYTIAADVGDDISYKINADVKTTDYKLTMDTIYVENVDTLTVGGEILSAAGANNEVAFYLKGSGLVLSPLAAEAHVTIAPYETKARNGLMTTALNADEPKIEVSGKYGQGLTLTGVKATVGSANVAGTLTVEGGATVTATGTTAGNLTVTGDESTAKLTDVTVGTKLEVGTGAVVTVASGTLVNVDVTGGTLTIGSEAEDGNQEDITINGTITVSGSLSVLDLGENVTLGKDATISVKDGAKARVPARLKDAVSEGSVDYYHEQITVKVGVEDVNGKPVKGAELTYKVGDDTEFAPVEGDVVYATTEDALALTVKVPEGYKVKTWRVNDKHQESTDTTYELTVDAGLTKVVAVLEEITPKVTFAAADHGTYTYSYVNNEGDTVSGEVKSGDADKVRTVKYGTEIDLVATPGEGYVFDHWAMYEISHDAELTYVVKADAVTIQPVFKRVATHDVTFEIEGKGTVTYTVDEDTKAVEVKDGDTVTVAEETKLTLTAEAAEGYEFVGWTIPGEAETVTTAEATYEVGADATITAVFKELPVAVEYTVTVDTKPATGGTVTYKVDKDTTAKAVTGPITFKEGETVTLTAKANDGYKFVEWQIDGKSVGKETTYTVTGDAKITAVFEKLPVTQYNLKITVDPANSGTVTGAGKYIAGATVNVTAKANTGYKFDGWFNAKNEKVSGDAEYSFAITADTELTAKFSAVEPEPEMVTVEVKATAGGTATVNGETKVEVEAGTTVTLVATAASGYEFVNWTDASDEEVTVGADGKYKAEKSVVLTANFKAKTPSGPVGPFIPSGPTGPSTPSHVCPSAAYTDVNQNMWYHEAVDYVVEHGYMQGTTATEFAPNANIKRADVALVLYRMQNSPAVEVGATYSDVDAGAYYAAAVAWADANGIVNGYGDGTFKPNKEITREELVAVMSRYAAYLNANVTGSASLARFVDAADVSAYAVAPMQWAVQTAIIQGTSISTLVPKHTATRAQFAAMIMRLCENVLAK